MIDSEIRDIIERYSKKTQVTNCTMAYEADHFRNMKLFTVIPMLDLTKMMNIVKEFVIIKSNHDDKYFIYIRNMYKQVLGTVSYEDECRSWINNKDEVGVIVDYMVDEYCRGKDTQIRFYNIPAEYPMVDLSQKHIQLLYDLADLEPTRIYP